MLIRVGLQLFSKALHEEVYVWLKSKDLLAFSLNENNFMEQLKAEPCDLVFLSETFLGNCKPKVLKEISELPDSPGILILSEKKGSALGYESSFAGALTVLPHDSDLSVIQSSIDAILAKRRAVQNFVSQIPPGIVEPRLKDFVSKSSEMEAFLRTAKRIVSSNASVLILGETGVGKEHLALAMHRESPRGKGPFVPINCAALPENLLESELFGHVQGAFTGAVRTRRGAFELAHNGTIFLDEIGDMPLHLQAKLLRVLQDKQFQKVGGEKQIKVDVRVMAATNKDLKAIVETGAFRRDLYYRLGVVSLMIPPLRNRSEDIPDLVSGYINHLARNIGSSISDIDESARNALLKYDWPGNIRELINVIERAILLGEGETISLKDLPEELTSNLDKGTALIKSDQSEVALNDEIKMFFEKDLLDLDWKKSRSIFLNRFEELYFGRLIKETAGKIGIAASKAGISPRAMHEKLSAHGIKKENYKK
jgi:DNA-binding NtrC family response regulator